MKKVHLFISILTLTLGFNSIAQEVELSGKVINGSEVENIHVINKTSQKFTITNHLGEFKIKGKLNDTLILSSIKYKLYSTIINSNNISSKQITIKLDEKVNELDEVIVGKVLTGDLSSDVKNSEAEPEINFYDLGIPGYTGKPKTQNERRLAEAGELKPKQLVGLLTGGLPLNPILNAISGRTKKLKERVKLETETSLIFDIKSRLSEDFFSIYPLEESKQIEFFYFCSEDPNFQIRCKDKSDIEIMEFLKEKYLVYTKNLVGKKD